jgi:hypothetical protein
MVLHGIVSPADLKFRKNFFGYVFLVHEMSKKRFRIVYDALAANVLTPAPPNPNFSPTPTMVHNLLAKKFGFVIDFRAFFFQVPLSPGVRSFYPFKAFDTIYNFNVLPMGFTLSLTLLWLAKKRCPGDDK